MTKTWIENTLAPIGQGEAAADLEVELLLSTPASIVVRARVEFADGSLSQEAGLVVARHRCRGDRPSAAALRQAAGRCVERLSRGAGAAQPRQVRCLSARVNGRWQLLLHSESA